jgi:dephospho-CoA kinase
MANAAARPGARSSTESSAVSKPVIGLVGGIGSGKSAAAAVMARRGGRVVAGDPAGHEALRQPAIRDRIARRWPAAVGLDGEIDRKTLGRIVFADPSHLRELEGIVFPWIKEQLRVQIDRARNDRSVRFVILDAAVMLEAGWNGVVDRLVFVDAPRDVRAARVAGRGWTADDLDRRERSQLGLAEKRARADAVLDNSGGPEELQRNVDELLAHLGLGPEST